MNTTRINSEGIVENQNLINKDFDKILLDTNFQDKTVKNDEQPSFLQTMLAQVLPEVKKETPQTTEDVLGHTLTPNKKSATGKSTRPATIYSEGLSLKDLSEKYIDSISVDSDIKTIADRVFDQNEKSPSNTSKKGRFVKKLREIFNTRVSQKVNKLNDDVKEEPRLKPKPDISINKTKLINQIMVNHSALGVEPPTELDSKTEGELEKILAGTISKIDFAGDSLDLRGLGYFMLESGAGISESLRPELFTGLKQKHIEHREHLKKLLGACLVEYEDVVKKYISPGRVLMMKLASLYGSVAIENMHKKRQ